MVKVEIENFVSGILSLWDHLNKRAAVTGMYTLTVSGSGTGVGDTYEIEEIPTGYHQLKVSLANNDHSTLILS